MLTVLLLVGALSGAPAPASAGPSPGVPPLDPLRVLHDYSPVGRYEAGDRGVDLAGSPGQQVVSSTAGVVTFAGQVAGRGVVSVTLADGRRVTYEPLAVSVAAGASLVAGAPIGRLSPGWPGCAAAACLHWGLAAGHGSTLTYFDPMTLLGPRHVRLLPLAGAPVGPASIAVRSASPEVAELAAAGAVPTGPDRTTAGTGGAVTCAGTAIAGLGACGGALPRRRRRHRASAVGL